jgi:hypothetical protein
MRTLLLFVDPPSIGYDGFLYPAQALAAEVVSLEERLLHLRSAELRLGKQVDEQRAAAKKAAAQAESAMHERENLAAAVEALRVR